MTQYTFSVDPNVHTGTDLANMLNAWKPAVHTNHRGTSRPSYAAAGMIWIDSSVAGTDSIYFFDGSHDVLLYQIDTATGDIILGGGGTPTKIENGTSKVEIASANGNVVATIGGIPALTISDTGLTTPLNLNVQGTTQLSKTVGVNYLPNVSHIFTVGKTVTDTQTNAILVYSYGAGTHVSNSANFKSIFDTGITNPASVYHLSCITEGSTKFYVRGDGYVYANNSIGFQQAAASAMLTIYYSSFATPHPFTALIPNNTFSRDYLNSLGTHIRQSWSSTGIAENWQAWAGSAPSGADTFGVFLFDGRKTDGATGATSLAAAESLFSILNNGAAAFSLKGNGDLKLTGGLTTVGSLVTGKTVIINQSALNDLMLDFASTYATAHPFTSVSGAGSLFSWAYIQDTGYLVERSCSASTIGRHWAIYSNGAPTTETSGVVDFRISNTDGSNGSTTHAATSTIFAIKNHFSAAFAVKGNGDTKITGQLTDYTAINSQTGTTYAPVLTDASKLILITNAAANTVTIPANASVAYPIGTRLNFMQGGAGQTTIAITTDTLNVNANLTKKLNGQHAIATAVKTAATTWILFGNLEAA